mmetsp:Transcript_59052/g.189932  ORF Transcript_59052/g.189932 Transcript_59052/m.189932 type:complete len:204 (+) Transcript_59052:892-1503(+)
MVHSHGPVALARGARNSKHCALLAGGVLEPIIGHSDRVPCRRKPNQQGKRQHKQANGHGGHEHLLPREHKLPGIEGLLHEGRVHWPVATALRRAPAAIRCVGHQRGVAVKRIRVDGKARTALGDGKAVGAGRVPRIPGLCGEPRTVVLVQTRGCCKDAVGLPEAAQRPGRRLLLAQLQHALSLAGGLPASGGRRRRSRAHRAH